LIDLGQGLSAARTPVEAARIIVDVAQILLGWDACTLDMFDSRHDLITPVLTMDTIDGRRIDVPNASTNALPNSMTRRVVQDGAQLILRDRIPDSSLEVGDKIADRAEASSASGLLMFGDTSRSSASLMFVPIRVQEQAIGVLSIQSYTHSAYDAETLAMLQGLADHCGGALERMRVEESLRDHQMRLEMALDAAHMGAWEWIASTDQVLWSANMEAILELPTGTIFDQEQITSNQQQGIIPGKRGAFYQMIHPEDLPRVDQVLQNAIYGVQATHQLEFRIVAPGGGVRWLELRGRMLYDAKGQPDRMVATIADIGERKQWEAARRENEERQRIFSEQLTMLHEVTLELSVATTVNDLCRRVVELGRSRLGYDRLSLWLIQGDPDVIQGTYGTDENGGIRSETHQSLPSHIPKRQRIFATSSVLVEHDVPLLNDLNTDVGHGWHMTAAVRDAQDIIGEINADNLLDKQPIRMHQAELLGLYGAMVGHLYTRLRAEEALRLSEEKFAKAFHASPDAITISTIDEGRFIEVNDGFVRMSGYTAAETIGRTTLDLALYSNPEERDGLIEALRHQGSLRDWNIGFRIRSGEIIECQTSIEIIELHGEKRMLAITRDVTEQKRAARQVQQLNAELEQRVRERTQQLEAANKELEAFTYSVSHDLRAPLRAMNGFARILLQEHSSQLDEGAGHYLNRIRSNAEQMGKLIDELLAFSRLGRYPLKVQRVEMQFLTRHVVEELRTDQAQRQIIVEIGALPSCVGDPGLLRQVLTNLIANAVKFTRTRNAARIEIGCEPGSKTPTHNTYFVRDNGVGFDPQYSDKLFGVFQRLHRVEEFEGSGVGLAIVKRIILRHGGQVWAIGQVEQGATFYFTLPVEPACVPL
jgi:PAS domain S-box-containing protein